MSAGPVTAGEVLGNRRYTVFLLSTFLSNIGTFMQALGVPFVLYELTERNAWVGGAVFATMGPSFVVLPIAGVLADRISRKKMLVWSNVIQLASAGALLLLSVRDQLTPWRIIALLIFGGFGSGFQNATTHAMVPQLVEPRHVPMAVRFNTVNFNVARVIGPAIAGVVLNVWGISGAFACNAASFLIALCGLAQARPRAVASVAGGSFREAYVAGLAHLRRYRSLQQLVWFSVVISAFGVSVSLLAAGLAAEAYGFGKRGLSLLITAFGVGATVTAVALVRHGDRLQRSKGALFGLVVYGVGAVLAGASGIAALGVIAFALMGVAHSTVSTCCNTAMQAQLVDEYRGRVLSIFVLSSFAATPLAAFGGGRVGDAIGIRAVVMAFGVSLVAWAYFAALRWQRLTSFDLEVAS